MAKLHLNLLPVLNEFATPATKCVWNSESDKSITVGLESLHYA
jgi:hypothetical protein